MKLDELAIEESQLLADATSKRLIYEEATRKWYAANAKLKDAQLREEIRAQILKEQKQ